MSVGFNVFVTASTSETQGLTVIEAMAASVTPVCIKDESFENVVIDQLSGRIFETKEEYISIITDLYDNPEKLTEFAYQARINSEVHSSKYYAERVLDVYYLSLGGRKRKKPKKTFFSTIKNVFKKGLHGK